MACIRIRLVRTCTAYVDFHGGASQYVGLGRECIDYRFIWRTDAFPIESRLLHCDDYVQHTRLTRKRTRLDKDFNSPV